MSLAMSSVHRGGRYILFGRAQTSAIAERVAPPLTLRRHVLHRRRGLGEGGRVGRFLFRDALPVFGGGSSGEEGRRARGGAAPPAERDRVVGGDAEGVRPPARGRREESDRQDDGARHRELHVRDGSGGRSLADSPTWLMAVNGFGYRWRKGAPPQSTSYSEQDPT